MSEELFKALAEDRPEHSDFPPSSAERWLNCHGYYAATKDLPWIPSGPAAERGTEAHALMDKSMRTLTPPGELSKDEELVNWVGHVLDYVSGYKVLHKDSKVFSEVYLPWFNVSGGTVDVLGISEEELLIADLKTGFKQVEVEYNPQLMLYAVAARHHLGARPYYRLVIIQPNGYHEHGPIREYLVSDEELTSFEEVAKSAIEANLKIGERTPGSHCKWCKAEAICKERAKYMLKQIAIEFEDLV